MSSQRALIITSVGTGLGACEYTVHLPPGLHRSDAVRGRSGASAVAACLPPTVSTLDLLVMNTEQTRPERSKSPLLAGQQWASGIVEHGVRRAFRGETVRVHHERVDWSGKSQPAQIKWLVGVPGTVVSVLAEHFGSRPADYDWVIVDIAAGLRTIGLGLWLTVAWLRESRPAHQQIVAFYTEFSRGVEPTPFDEEISFDRASTGAVVDVTDFFDTMDSIQAVGQLTAGLDYRKARALVQHLSPAALDDPRFDLFAVAAQLGLDLEAARHAALLSPGASGPATTGPERLGALLADAVAASAHAWTGIGTDGAPVTNAPEGPKDRWPLGDAEVKRTAWLIDRLLDAGRLSDAAGQVREYMTTVVQASLGEHRWLSTRKRPDGMMQGLLWLAHRRRYDTIRLRAPLVSDGELEALVGVSRVRNDLAHVGRRGSWVDATGLESALRTAWDTLRPPDGPLAGWLANDGWPARIRPYFQPGGAPLVIVSADLDRAAVDALLSQRVGRDAVMVTFGRSGGIQVTVPAGGWSSRSLDEPLPISEPAQVGSGVEISVCFEGAARPPLRTDGRPVPTDKLVNRLLLTLDRVLFNAPEIIEILGPTAPYNTVVASALADALEQSGAERARWFVTSAAESLAVAAGVSSWEVPNPPDVGRTPSGPTAFCNISNHPSTRWSQPQRDAALALADHIVDIPFPEVPPEADGPAVRRLAENLDRQVPESTAAAMIQGEFTLVHALVDHLQRRGVTCLAATSTRSVTEQADGSRVVRFDFVRYREYPRTSGAGGR